MEMNKNDMGNLKITPERAALIGVLKSMADDGELEEFAKTIEEGYRESLKNLQPLLSGRDMKRMAGTVIALRQVADQVVNDCRSLDIPLFEEMCSFFGEHLGFEKISWAQAPKEDDDE